jgi:hypothetical protein
VTNSPTAEWIARQITEAFIPLQPTFFIIEIGPSARLSAGAYAPWAFGKTIPVAVAERFLPND